MRSLRIAVLVAAVLAAACSGGDDDGGEFVRDTITKLGAG